MEYVGKAVKKEFKGFGTFSGVVNSYDCSSGFFEVLYEDGDSEEMDLSEVISLLEEKGMVAAAEAELADLKPMLGPKPKKRRKLELEHDFRGESGNDCDVNLVKDGLNHAGVLGTLEDLKRNFNSNDGWNLNNGLNSNDQLNLNDNSGDGLNLNVSVEENLERTKCIDLNLEAEGDFDEAVDVGLEIKKECSFDLNLGLDEESKDDFGGEFKESNAFQMVEETRKKEIDGFVEESHMGDSVLNGNLDEICFDNVERNSVKALSLSTEHVSKDAHLVLGGGIVKGEAAIFIEEGKTPEIGLKEIISEAGTMVDHDYQEDIGSSCRRGTRGRKRRKLADNLKPRTELGLRRSTRKGAVTISSPNHLAEAINSFVVNDVSSSPVGSVVSEEKPVTGCEKPEDPCIPPAKLQLPPSSQNFSVDGVPLLDLFSIYACLRSFSTLLFLSPFELEDFVVALNCKSPSLLFDFIHVSILQTLRKHLEFLSEEGSESASNCLRCLNWGLLDLITWPLFMVEYLLIHGSAPRTDFDLNCLKLVEYEYYRQPATVKVEVLRWLCDDVVEVEAIRSELNRRSLTVEPHVEFDQIVNVGMSKKRRVMMDAPGGSGFTEEVVDETTDGNSDECCLCKMDGSLICCDGCPAAYHSRCVGVANDLLPEGEWYCPECVIDKDKPWMKPRKSLRGAELLGIDPDGRLYYTSCGYLLVLDSCDSDFSFNYYHRNDLNVVIEVLKSSDIRFGGILTAISRHWDIPIHCSEGNCSLDCLNRVSCSGSRLKGQTPVTCLPSFMLAPSRASAVKDEMLDVKKGQENLNIDKFSGLTGQLVESSVNLLDAAGSNHYMKLENPLTSSEGSAEIIQAASAGIQNCQKHGRDLLSEPVNYADIPGQPALPGDSSLTSSTSNVKRKKNVESAVPVHFPSAANKIKEDSSQVVRANAYINCYSFAQMASSVAEELSRKSSDKYKEDSAKSVEEIVSLQLKAISKKISRFCWPNIQNVPVDAEKEKCGWCYYCQAPDDDRDCLFKMNDAWPVQEGSKSEAVSLQSKRNRKGHLIDVICYILSIEDRLRGLLVGPWLNPHYSKHWRRSVLKAADVASVKRPLLTLESNLRHLALSAEWLKLVDSVVTMGSASHVVTSSVRVASKHGISRKRGKCSDLESTSSSNTASGLSMYWWRGGRVSRHLFNWKVLPHALARKAARQAGCAKIPGIIYPDSSEFAKRSRNIAWRAAVETSTCVEQLAFLVRDLDSNIKWDDIENTHPLSKMDECKKSIRPFKKVIIRRKSIEGTSVKYLLDFGKRKIIPDIVVRHGSMLEESSSGRKKFWLEESHVPLHLLKAFEEKRVMRKASKVKPGKLVDGARVKKKPVRSRGFSYLFSKAERSEYYQCGHCNKDVPIREAVNCQYCEASFHKRHVRKSAGAITAECTYTCHRCHEGKHVRKDTKKGKVQAQVNKKASTTTGRVKSKMSKKSCMPRQVQSHITKKVSAVVPLRRSPRKLKFLSLQNKKIKGRKKGKRIKSKKRTSVKPKEVTSWQKKRTGMYRTYWLNGLLLSRKPNDERVTHFERNKLILPSKDFTFTPDKPKCRLCCETGYTPSLNYICCEICGDWFHGDAFGLDAEKICNLIGFRCHSCRKRASPPCPHLRGTHSGETCLCEERNNAGVECSEGGPNAVLSPGELYVKQSSDPVDGSRSPFLIIESHREEEHSSMTLSPNQSLVLESALEVENGCVSIRNKHKTDAIQDFSDKALKPDVITDSNETLLVGESTIISGEVVGVVNPLEVDLSCKSDMTVINTELEACNDTKDGLEDTMPLKDGLEDTMPVKDGLKDTMPVKNGLEDTIAVKDGLEGTMPVKDGLEGTMPVKDGLDGTMPVKDGL